MPEATPTLQLKLTDAGHSELVRAILACNTEAAAHALVDQILSLISPQELEEWVHSVMESDFGMYSFNRRRR